MILRRVQNSSQIVWRVLSEVGKWDQGLQSPTGVINSPGFSLVLLPEVHAPPSPIASSGLRLWKGDTWDPLSLLHLLSLRSGQSIQILASPNTREAPLQCSGERHTAERCQAWENPDPSRGMQPQENHHRPLWSCLKKEKKKRMWGRGGWRGEDGREGGTRYASAEISALSAVLQVVALQSCARKTRRPSCGLNLNKAEELD